jgi:VanZ family protein
MTVIFVASSIPGREMPTFGGLDLLAKKGGHMLGYALLSCAYLLGLTRGAPGARRRVMFAALLAVLYAASDEFHQQFTPGRSASVGDVGIDGVGALVGAMGGNRLFAFLRRRRQSA